MTTPDNDIQKAISVITQHASATPKGLPKAVWQAVVTILTQLGSASSVPSEETAPNTTLDTKSEALSLFHQEEKRKRSIVVINFPYEWNMADNAYGNMLSSKQAVNHRCVEEQHIKEFLLYIGATHSIETIFRMTNKVTKIVFNSRAGASNALSKFGAFMSKRSGEFGKVTVRPSLTFEEREKRRQLQLHRNYLMHNNNSEWIVYKGTLCLRGEINTETKTQPPVMVDGWKFKRYGSTNFSPATGSNAVPMEIDRVPGMLKRGARDAHVTVTHKKHAPHHILTNKPHHRMQPYPQKAPSTPKRDALHNLANFAPNTASVNNQQTPPNFGPTYTAAPSQIHSASHAAPIYTQQNPQHFAPTMEMYGAQAHQHIVHQFPATTPFQCSSQPVVYNTAPPPPPATQYSSSMPHSSVPLTHSGYTQAHPAQYIASASYPRAQMPAQSQMAPQYEGTYETQMSIAPISTISSGLQTPLMGN